MINNFIAYLGATYIRGLTVQSTPVISRHLGAKIRERELSGSPVISRESAKAQTGDFHGSESHTVTSARLITKQYVER